MNSRRNDIMVRLRKMLRGNGRAAGLTFLLLIFSGFWSGASAQNSGQMAARVSVSEAEMRELLARPLTLEDCIGIAMQRNIQLEMARQDLDIAQLSASGSYAIFYPSISLMGRQLRRNQHRPVDPNDIEEGDPPPVTDFQFDNKILIGSLTQQFITGGKLTFSTDLRRDIDSPDFFGAPPTTTNNRTFSFSFSQPLLRDGWFTMAKSPITLAKKMLRVKERLYDANKLQTIFDVKKSFYSVLLQREIVKANQAAIARDSSLIRLSQAKYQASMATRRDVLSAEIQLAEDQASLIAAQADYQSAMDKLKDAMGLPVDAPLQIVDVELNYSNKPFDENKLIERALAHNPQVAAVQANIERLRFEHKLARNKLLPRLDLNIGYEDNFDRNTARAAQITSKDFEVTLNLSYSFQERDLSLSASAQQKEIALNQERRNLEDAKRQVILSIRNIVRSIYTSAKALEVLKKNIDAANEKVRFATTMFNLGRASNLDITDAQQALLRAEILYIRNVTNYNILLAQLETLVGGPIEHSL